MKRNIVILILFASWYASIAAFHPLENLYSGLFGNQDASLEYQNEVRDALIAMGNCDVEFIPVKKMNTLANKLIEEELSSFTLFGIWLNEDILNSYSQEVRTFQLYHEAAHYTLDHHANALGFGLTLYSLSLISASANINEKNLARKIIAYLIEAGLLIGLSNYALKPFIREQEKEADLYALRVLFNQSQIPTIVSYLEFLKNLIAKGQGNLETDWHYSVYDQYDYLRTSFISLSSTSF